jgi:hypothetical protein
MNEVRHTFIRRSKTAKYRDLTRKTGYNDIVGSDLPVLLVGLFSSHDFINPHGIGTGVGEQSIFHRDVHSPAGFAGMKFPDVT